MGVNKFEICLSVARINHTIANKIFNETTAYHMAVVVLYYSLYMYLLCLCECQKNIGYPSTHDIEISIVDKNLKTSSDYKTLYSASGNFRYKPHMIIGIQDKKYKKDIEKYFNYYKNCVKEISQKIKNCGFGN